MRYGPLYIMVLNKVIKFLKVVIKITELIDRTSIKMVNFHEQRLITPEGMVRYGPLSNMKTKWY